MVLEKFSSPSTRRDDAHEGRDGRQRASSSACACMTSSEGVIFAYFAAVGLEEFPVLIRGAVNTRSSCPPQAGQPAGGGSLIPWWISCWVRHDWQA